MIGETYTLELAFDGTDVVSRVNGRECGRVSAGPRQAGAVFLVTSSDLALTVDEVVIEGTPTQESVEMLRERWIEERLAALGFQ